METFVLVTGANSGIGYQIVKLLNSKNIRVIAGIRRMETQHVFDDMDQVVPMELDVAQPESITDFIAELTDRDYTISHLVNNAGILYMIPVAYANMEDIERIFQVNVFGVYRLTQRLIPHIIQSKGRIVLISSISGFWSGFTSSPYSMTKHAIEALGDSLVAEMRKFDVKVSLIEPGNFESNIGKGNRNKIIKQLQNIDENIYEDEFARYLGLQSDGTKINNAREGTTENLPTPEPVAEATYHALFDKSPKRRYFVPGDLETSEYIIKWGLSEILQLNRDHKYSLSKETLHTLVDELYDTDGFVEEI